MDYKPPETFKDFKTADKFSQLLIANNITSLSGNSLDDLEIYINREKKTLAALAHLLNTIKSILEIKKKLTDYWVWDDGQFFFITTGRWADASWGIVKNKDDNLDTDIEDLRDRYPMHEMGRFDNEWSYYTME
jgi:hypothetical protein